MDTLYSKMVRRSAQMVGDGAKQDSLEYLWMEKKLLGGYPKIIRPYQ